MDNFKYENPTKYYFGRRQLANIGDEITGAKTVMLVYGEKSVTETGLYERIEKIVRGVEADIVDFGGIAGNATWNKVEEGAKLADEKGVDYILGIGGGTVMDCAKAIALVARQERAWKKHWVRDDAIIVDPIRVGLVVTCPGSGSEGNGCAVVLNEKSHLKTGRDYPQLAPRFAILEPELSYTLPAEQTIAGAFATLSTLIETYFSQPMGSIIADDLLEAAMMRVMSSLEAVLENPEDYNARANLMWASTAANNDMLKCGKQGVFQCRMIARQITAFTGCSYGLALASIHAQYLRFVKVTSIYATSQLKRLAMNVWGIDPTGKSDIDVAIQGIDAFRDWTQKVGAYRTLRELGVTDELVPKIGKSTQIIPMKYCRLNGEDIEILLEQCL